MTPVAETLWGTPVYCYPGEVAAGIIPRELLKRSQGVILPATSEFSAFLRETLPRKDACVIMRYGRFIRIFKLNRNGEVFTVTARSIREGDRKRLVESGVLRG